MIQTFTGSPDEDWFYLISVTVEGRGAVTIPLMLEAIGAAHRGDEKVVQECLYQLSGHLRDLGMLLDRMHERCDPYLFYHHIRPYLAGSKDMAEAGLPRGVLYDTGSDESTYRQYSGGSNAQSSLIHFFDIVLGVRHLPTGQKCASADRNKTNNFIQVRTRVCTKQRVKPGLCG